MADTPLERGHRSTAPHRLAGFDYSSPDVAYFLTLRAHAGTPFTDSRLADEVIASLYWLREHRSIALYAYCLMPDHLHLLLQLPSQQANSTPPPVPSGRPRPAAITDPPHALGTQISSFKSFTTHRSWKLGYRGALWQARFYDHIVRMSEDGWRIAAYILENPERKGIVMKGEAYPYRGMPDPMS